MGSFTLPHQTQWGIAVLPAGHYTLTLEHAMQSEILKISQGTHGVALEVPHSAAFTGTSGGSFISIVGNRVRELHLAPVGLTYSYGMPKNERRQILGRLPHRTVVAVAAAATK